MAGHQGGRPGRVETWRKRYWTRLKQASTGIDRVGAAADHLRLVLAKCATPEQQEAIAKQAVADLAGPAEELLSAFEAKGKKRS